MIEKDGAELRPYGLPIMKSMAGAVWVHDLGCLLAYLECAHRIHVRDVRELKQHYHGYDKASGWDAWVVTFRSHPLLWSNGPVPGLPRFQIVERESRLTIC